MIAFVALMHLAAALQGALERHVEELELPDAPPVHHLRYQLLALEQVSIQTSFDSLVHLDALPTNRLAVEVRVGSPEFDNTGFGGWQNGFDAAWLPERLTPEALSVEAWRLTDRAYKQAVEQYARKQAQFTPPDDHPGDYSPAPVVVVDLEGAPAAPVDQLQDLALRLGAALRGPELLERAEVYLGHESGWLWTFDSDGSSVRRPVQETSIRVLAHARANDGMLLTDERLFTVRDPDGLGEVDALVEDVARMRESLGRLRAAPVLTEEYVGPLVFEGEAAADLFRYLLVPQLEGTPSEIPFQSQFGSFGASGGQARTGRRVLPPGWSVVDDPTADPSHPGAFEYDLEGTRAEAVQCVEDGIVRELLMSRTPRPGQLESNGHARGSLGSRGQGRASLTSVEPHSHVSSARLHRAAARTARAYGRDWYLVVRELQEPSVRRLAGHAATALDGPTGELPPPVAVWRVYADGREEPLRGARFASADRWLLRDVVAAGPRVETSYLAPFEGTYRSLAPIEGLPGRMSAHEVLVGEVELVPMGADASRVPILPPPSP